MNLYTVKLLPITVCKKFNQRGGHTLVLLVSQWWLQILSQNMETRTVLCLFWTFEQQLVTIVRKPRWKWDIGISGELNPCASINCQVTLELHDDGGKTWKHFHWPFMWGITLHRWFPWKWCGALMFSLTLAFLLNKQSSCQWLKTSCKVTVMARTLKLSRTGGKDPSGCSCIPHPLCPLVHLFYPVLFQFTYVCDIRRISDLNHHGPLNRYVQLWVAHAPAMPGTFSPPSKETAS